MSIFIRNNLKYYRQKRAISQETLAHLTGIHKRTISRIERDKTRIPYPKTRELIAQVLNICVDKIFPPVKYRNEINP